MACAAGQTEVAKLLIDSNASVNPTILIDPLNSPLHEAVMKGKFFSEIFTEIIGVKRVLNLFSY